MKSCYQEFKQPHLARLSPIGGSNLEMAAFLSELCMNGDVAGLRSAIEGGADVNSRSPEGKTPLMLALWNHQNAVVEMLTEMDEVDINCEDNDGATALHHAVDVDNDHGAVVLLAQPSLLDVNHRNNKGLSALMLAVSKKKVKCATLLLDDPRVDLDTRDNFKRAPQDIERWGNFFVFAIFIRFSCSWSTFTK